MAVDILGYEILGESVNDLLEGEFDDDDLLGEDEDEDLLELLGEDEDDDDEDELLGAELVIGEEEYLELLGADPDMVGRRRRRRRRGRRARRARAKKLAARQIRTMRRPARRAARARQTVAIRRPPSAQSQAAAMVLAQNAAIIKAKVPTESREFPMGFDSVGTVAAGANVQIISRPQVTFRPERLVISGGIAARFLVNDLDRKSVV